MDKTVFDFSAASIAGEDVPLSAFRGQVLLIVNVASKCGFTPQYQGLESLHETYRGKGFAVLGFPCNQFASQEPGSSEEISSFCKLNYGVTFPLFAKIAVNGKDAHPLFRFLQETLPGVFGIPDIKWNFTKFLVGRDGVPVKRYSPDKKPEDIAKEIEIQIGK